MVGQQNQQSSHKKNIVITGANSGIGLEVARQLFSDGHHVFFGSRNQQRNLEAATDIKRSFPQSIGSINYYQLDLSQRASIDKFTEEVKKHFKYIDILINNSGFMANELRLNQNNIEMTMAVNHFGHFYLTYLLFPLIKDVKEGRVVNVSSSLHKNSDKHPAEDLACQKEFGFLEQYNTSKLANTMFSVGLAERFKKAGYSLKAVSLHPGVVMTRFHETSGFCCLKWLTCCCCCFLRNQESGAESTLHVCRCRYEDLQNGQYYDSDCQIVRKHEKAEDLASVEKLWIASEKVYQIEFKI